MYSCRLQGNFPVRNNLCESIAGILRCPACLPRLCNSIRDSTADSILDVHFNQSTLKFLSDLAKPISGNSSEQNDTNNFVVNR
jgi:hypothetical protein